MLYCNACDRHFTNKDDHTSSEHHLRMYHEFVKRGGVDGKDVFDKKVILTSALYL